MKLLLLASLIAFSAAVALYQTKTISVNENGIILISSPSGRLVTISRSPAGQGLIEITFSGPSIGTRRIEIVDDALYGISRTSTLEVLCEILGQYRGTVDEGLYEQLLVQVGKAARSGLISREVFELLVVLEQFEDPLIVQKIEGILVSGSGRLPLGRFGAGYGLGGLVGRTGGIYSGAGVGRISGVAALTGRGGLPVSRTLNPLLAQRYAAVYGSGLGSQGQGIVPRVLPSGEIVYEEVPFGVSSTRGIPEQQYLLGRSGLGYAYQGLPGFLSAVRGGYLGGQQPVVLQGEGVILEGAPIQKAVY